MAIAIKLKARTTIALNSRVRKSTKKSLMSMVIRTPSATASGQGCEKFVYRNLTLPPKIWSRVYDAMGNVLEENFCESDGSLIFRWTYLFDERGRKTQGNLHNSEGALIASWFYNEHQEVKKRLLFNARESERRVSVEC